MVKIEHYTVLRRQIRIVKGLLQVGLPRVLDSKKYSSNVLVLEYSFNSASGRKFQFPVPVFQINKQLLELYANLVPSPSSWDLQVASFATQFIRNCVAAYTRLYFPYLLLLSAVMTCNLY